MTPEDRLRERLIREGAATPLAGIDLAETLRRGRSIRTRRIVGVTVVAATLIALSVTGAVVMGGSDDVAPQPVGTVSPTPAGAETEAERVERSLRGWLDAIRAGDETAAWNLMSPQAQEQVGRETFDEMMASELPEGLGAFADAPGFHPVEMTAEHVVGVVQGEVTREGSTEYAALAVPLRVVGDEVLIDDPIVGRGKYQDRVATFASVSAGPLFFEEGDELIVEFADAGDVVDVSIALDEDPRPLATAFDPSTGTATATLDRDLEEGTHIATVIVTDRSGRLYPEAIVFDSVALSEDPDEEVTEERCSASHLDAEHVPEVQDLPEPVAAMRDAIVDSALDCDYDALSDLALEGRNFFSFSFGTSEQVPGNYWRDIEKAKDPEMRDPVLRLLIETLDLSYCTDEFQDPDGDGRVTSYVWPSASCRNPSQQDWAELEGLYSAEEIDAWKDFGSFIGWRIGIYADGDWTFYIAGD